jgi:hypothetical protein
MLAAMGDGTRASPWVLKTPVGSADEQKPAVEGTVEAWARSPDNPVGGWYGPKKGPRETPAPVANVSRPGYPRRPPRSR